MIKINKRQVDGQQEPEFNINLTEDEFIDLSVLVVRGIVSYGTSTDIGFKLAAIATRREDLIDRFFGMLEEKQQLNDFSMLGSSGKEGHFERIRKMRVFFEARHNLLTKS